MRVIEYISIIVVALFVSASVNSGHFSLSPSGHLPIILKSSTNGSAFAVKFDLSSIPKDVNIDLAELRITVNSDTSLGNRVHIKVFAAQSNWTASDLPSKITIEAADSLSYGKSITTGAGNWLEINVNRMVKLWHSGDLPNRGFYIEIEENESKGFSLEREGADWKAELSVYYSK